MANNTKEIGKLIIAIIAIVLLIAVIPPANASTNATQIQPFWARHLSLSVQDAPVTNSSTVIASPPPRTPDTTPIVLNLVTNFNVTRHGLSSPAPKTYVNGIATAPEIPTQGWALIELVFTGRAMGLVYDSGYSFNVNNNTVFWGSSPEYGNWTVYSNLTLYEALFNGTFFWQWNSPGAIINGTFLTNISLYFYPADSNFPAPKEPNMVVPVLPTMSSGGWHMSPSDNFIINNVTLPDNIEQAILQVWAYGFSYDEFWYSNEPSFRAIIVSVDGNNISSILPFPYINTGGIYLFSWRPITGVFTMNDRFYMLPMNAFLGMIEGTHEWSFKMPVLMPGWSIAASMLLYTDASAGRATQVSQYFHMSNISTYQVGTPGVSAQAIFDQYDNISYSGTSTLSINGAQVEYSLNTSEMFYNDQFITPVWQNISGNEITSTVQHISVIENGVYHNNTLTEKTYFPIAMDTYFAISITHTTNGGYPMYGLADFGLTNLTQGWIQVDTNLEQMKVSVVEDIVTSNDAFAITNLTLISPTAGYLGVIYSATGFTAKSFIYVGMSSTFQYYRHYLVAGSEDLVPSNYVQPIYMNAVYEINY